MILYHYTSEPALILIMRECVINTTESWVGAPSFRRGWAPHGPHVGPDVVWLTSSLDLWKSPHSSRLSRDKVMARITVEVNDAEPWLTWSARQRMSKPWRRQWLRELNVHHFYVVERPVPIADWRRVEGWFGRDWRQLWHAVVE